MKTRVMAIKDIKIKKEVYPRHSEEWIRSIRYAEAIEAGAKLPPIDIVKYQGVYVLIDGFHRIQAHKRIQEKFISANIHKDLTEKEIFIMALKLNLKHGIPLTTYDRANAIVKLRNYGISNTKISEIFEVKVERLKQFAARKIAYATSGEEIALKGSISAEYAGRTITKTLSDAQLKIVGDRPDAIIRTLIILLENDSLDIHNTHLMGQLKKLGKLISMKLKEYRV